MKVYVDIFLCFIKCLIIFNYFIRLEKIGFILSCFFTPSYFLIFEKISGLKSYFFYEKPFFLEIFQVLRLISLDLKKFRFIFYYSKIYLPQKIPLKNSLFQRSNASATKSSYVYAYKWDIKQLQFRNYLIITTRTITILYHQ